MVVFILPLMWLIDFMFGVFSDDPSVARYLMVGAIMLPIMIAIGLVVDTVRFFFPSLFDENRNTEITPAERVGDKSASTGNDA